MLKRLLLATAATVAFGSTAYASPVEFGTSAYEFVSGAIDWADASAAAEALLYDGVAGHLATVTSAAENSFLLSIAPTYDTFAGAWLGGDHDGWVVGPEAGESYGDAGYKNFGGSEPNDTPSNSYMNVGPLNVSADIGQGEWADANSGQVTRGDPIVGYFVEWDIATVPLPTSVVLFGSGLVLLGLLGRRRCASPVAA